MRRSPARQEAPQEFIWTPSVGPDAQASARLRASFPKPRHPMGEAWFMGKRRMYTELMEQDLEDLPIQYFQNVLEELFRGACGFGLIQEWDDWYHFLLPRLLSRSFEKSYSEYPLEYLISAFMAVHPDRVREDAGNYLHHRYPALRQDVLVTLGRSMMAPELWESGEIVPGRALHPAPLPPAETFWAWSTVSGDFSASMFFCLKYLEPDEIDPWLQSVFRIESSYWRAQLLVWLLGIKPLLDSETMQSGQLSDELLWEPSYTLGYYHRNADTPFLLASEANRRAFRGSLSRRLTAPLFLEWIDSFARVVYLEGELGNLPDQFVDTFLSGSLFPDQ